MTTPTAPDMIDQQRRRLFGAAAVTLASAPFVANAQAEPVKQTGGVGTANAFGPLKQIHAGPLDIGYAEAGPANGPAVILLTGIAGSGKSGVIRGVIEQLEARGITHLAAKIHRGAARPAQVALFVGW